jgi:tetratricopeptide (TPR) repeat protein
MQYVLPAKLHRLCGVLALTVLSACATTSGRAPEPVASDRVPAAEPVSERMPIDEEVMYRVFAAEYLGAEGDLPAAVGEYLEAAMLSEDPAIAKRATQVAFATESWQQAAMAADRWAFLEPDNLTARESAAAAMISVGDFVGARFQMQQILDQMEDSSEAWQIISNLLAQSGNPQRADRMLNDILAEREGVAEADVLHARSQLAVRAGQPEQAFELARRAVELEPKRIEFITWAGRLALSLKLQEMALEYFRQAWRLDPEDHDLSLAYADLLARTGNPDAARKVMREMPQSPDVMFSRILFELAAQERSAAEALYEEFEQLRFEDAQEQAFYQAQAAEALGMNRQAIELFGQVTEGERALSSVVRRAELLAMEGELDAARASLARLRTQVNPMVVEESWLAEAQILREYGESEEAVRVLDRALEHQPRSVAILYSHALLAAELGWVDVAEKSLRSVLAEQPDNASALNALGYTLADQTDRYEEAEALIRQAFILEPDQAAIIDSMGWIAFRLGRHAEAIEYLRRAFSIDRNAEIGAHLGEVLWVIGQRDAARAVWRESVKVDPQNPVLVETLERLGVKL